jgi:hypothetical protein
MCSLFFGSIVFHLLPEFEKLSFSFALFVANAWEFVEKKLLQHHFRFLGSYFQNIKQGYCLVTTTPISTGIKISCNCAERFLSENK